MSVVRGRSKNHRNGKWNFWKVASKRSGWLNHQTTMTVRGPKVQQDDQAYSSSSSGDIVPTSDREIRRSSVRSYAEPDKDSASGSS